MTKKIPVMELFGPTIEGEGALIGHQTHFIRFGLCDYKCGRCDTMFAVDPMQVRENALWLTNAETFEAFMDHIKNTASHIRNVVFSGGNPCIHDLTDLVVKLRKAGYKIFVETQGSKVPEWLNLVDFITVSPKGEGMQEQKVMDVSAMEEILNLPVSKCLKVPIFDQRDIEFAVNLMELYPWVSMYLSVGNINTPPSKVDTDLLRARLLHSYEEILKEVLYDKRLAKAIILPQMHVLLWGNKKGV